MEGLWSRFYVYVCTWVCLHANGSCSSFANKDRGYHRTTMDNFITYPWLHAVPLLPLLRWDPSLEHYYLGEHTVNTVWFHQCLVWRPWQSLVKALGNNSANTTKHWWMQINICFIYSCSQTSFSNINLFEKFAFSYKIIFLCH